MHLMIDQNLLLYCRRNWIVITSMLLNLALLVPISPIFYARVSCTKVSRTAFLHLHFRFVLFGARWTAQKPCINLLVKLTTYLPLTVSLFETSSIEIMKFEVENQLHHLLSSVLSTLMRKICLWWFDNKLDLCNTLPLLPQKNDTRFKNGQNWLKNNHLATLI